jgi:hypothetical protein
VASERASWCAITLPPGLNGVAWVVGLDDVFIALANSENIVGDGNPASGGLYYTTQNNGAWGCLGAATDG